MALIGVLILYVALAIGYLVVAYRRRVRWPVHAVAEAITLDDVPPLVRPIVMRTAADLAGLGFELIVLTRAQRGVVHRNPRFWYRVAFLNGSANHGAILGWWDLSPRNGGSPIYLSTAWLRLFRYTDPAGYAFLERRVAHAGRFDQGRWAYEPLADAVSMAAAYGSFKEEGGPRPARPFPFGSTSELVSLIEADTDRRMKVALAKTTRVDRTGCWYVPTWRAAARAVLRPKGVDGSSISADRGFAILTRKGG